jgi:hypothetical protein
LVFNWFKTGQRLNGPVFFKEMVQNTDIIAMLFALVEKPDKKSGI